MKNRTFFTGNMDRSDADIDNLQNKGNKNKPKIIPTDGRKCGFVYPTKKSVIPFDPASFDPEDINKLPNFEPLPPVCFNGKSVRSETVVISLNPE